jgi:hypothetical protein
MGGGNRKKNAKKKSIGGGYLMVNLALSPMIERRALNEAKKKRQPKTCQHVYAARNDDIRAQEQQEKGKLLL